MVETELWRNVIVHIYFSGLASCLEQLQTCWMLWELSFQISISNQAYIHSLNVSLRLENTTLASSFKRVENVSETHFGVYH